MRILTVRNPWAWGIFHGKNVENRSRNIAGDYRGPVAIIAARAWDKEWRGRAGGRELASAIWAADFPDLDFGAIIGVVDLESVHDSGECWEDDMHRLAALYRKHPEEVTALPDNGGGGLIGRVRHCSPWADPDHFHLVLANPRPLSEPIPYRGSLGLRRLDAYTIERIEAAL